MHHYVRLSIVVAFLVGCPAAEEGDGGGSTDGSTGIPGDGDGDGTPSGTPGDGSGDGSGDGTADGGTGPGTGDGPGTGSDSGSDGSTDATNGSSSDGSSDGGTTGEPVCVQTECGGQLYECGDCQDNDRDGGADQFDVECVSPCDDDESSFATGLPGDNQDLCNQDCFFDGNSGSGNDGCEWFLACDPLDPDQGECSLPGGQECPDTFSKECLEACEVPNGCDCFGCCTVVIGREELSILIGAPGCALDNLDACPVCTPVAECSDPCEPDDCELCFGETELPEGCKDPECRGEQTPCRVNEDCGDNQYCQTGCCAPTPV
jgi:hypothetical protein